MTTTTRPKTKTNIRRISDFVEFKGRPWCPKCLFDSFHHVCLFCFFCFFVFVFLKEPGMIHPPAGPTSSRIREEKKKEIRIWERKSSENKKRIRNLSRWDDAPLGWWGSLIATHSLSINGRIFSREKMKKKYKFRDNNAQHPLLSTRWAHNIFWWSSRKRWLNRSLVSLLIFIHFFFLNFSPFFFSLFLRCCINSFPSCDVFTYLNTAYLSSFSLYTYTTYLSVWVIFFFSTWRGIKNVLMSLDGTCLERSQSS